jgi:hypothetical protein
MPLIRLSHDEVHNIAHHLRVAAVRYGELAERFTGDFVGFADVFKQQAADALKLAEDIER